MKTIAEEKMKRKKMEQRHLISQNPQYHLYPPNNLATCVHNLSMTELEKVIKCLNADFCWV
jgi:hypothetical protein